MAPLLILFCLVAAGSSSYRLEQVAAERKGEEELLYLPNGKLLKLASLGQAPVLADLIYLWAIQYYSNYTRASRYLYVEHVFGNVITELEPHNVDPYWLGALILSLEAKDTAAALRLLDKGFEHNPDQWILPYMAGWTAQYAQQYALAADYFDVAARVPEAPPVVLRLRAGMINRLGDLRQAIDLWTEVLEDPRSDATSVEIAQRQIRDLSVRADLIDLERALARFRNENDRYPARLDELVSRSYIPSLPTDPDGNAYLYDGSSGQVSSMAGRILGDHQ